MNGRATTPATSTCTRRDHAGHDLEVHGHLPSHADYHVVCIRVGGNDYVLCMLHVLQGEAEREVVRVPVECCLQEAGWNPYYALLLGRLAAAATSHAVTLQYCLWDHFRVGAMLPLRGSPAHRVGLCWACPAGGCRAASAAARVCSMLYRMSPAQLGV